MTWLIVQCVGVLLIAILSILIARSVRRTFLDYWTVAWICLSLSLISLAISGRVYAQSLFLALYYFGEYAFGFFFVAGCRNYATQSRLTRRHLYALIPFGLLAATLTLIKFDFNRRFIIHAAVLAGFFVGALIALKPARGRDPRSLGLRVMAVALLLLALDFMHYVGVVSYIVWIDQRLQYLRSTAVIDLILEILLGFGTVMLVLEDARHEVEATNRELVAARDRLEILARMDPLTEALNRHAFHSLFEKQQEFSDHSSGCAVVIDIDNLKPINDRYGHTVGDAAIREVARRIRSVIRADDLLFRWGGDEFLILFFNMNKDEAHRRIGKMNEALNSIQLNDSPSTIPLVVSYGVEAFSTVNQIEQAIDKADSAMYANKHSRKS
ncbi:MAG TPA: GGDEF domain-containing protein [Blastocatellia bacterium]